MKTKQLLTYQSLALVTGLAVFAALWEIHGTAYAQSTPTPTPTPPLFASISGPTCGFGCASIYEYTHQYIPVGPPSSVVASTLFLPRGLVFDNTGNLFVASNTLDSSGNNYQATILKITPDGLMSTFASGFPINFFLEGLVFDSSGNLFVMAENTNDSNAPGTIFEVTSKGIVSPFGLQNDCVQQGTDVVNCSTPGFGLGLAFDSAGNLYAADCGNPAGNPIPTQSPYPTIYKFTPEGVRTVFAGPDFFPTVGSTQLEGPFGLAFDTSGNLFVSTQDVNNANNEILKFTPGATPGATPTKTITAAEMPTNCGAKGLAFDAFGNLFVAEAGFNGASGAIQEFPLVGASPTPSPAPTPIYFASGISSQNNHGPQFLAFAPPNTPVASNVTTAVTFTSAATSPGTNTVTSITDPTTVGALPTGIVCDSTHPCIAFEITTKATYTLPVIIAFQVSPPLDVTTLKVLHWNSKTSTWDDITCPNPMPGPSPDTTTNTVYGSVSSFSPFAITTETLQAQIQPPISSSGSSVFNAKRGGLPVVFTLTSNGAATCQLPPATISLTRNGSTVVKLSSSNFKISNCQYVYNLTTSSLGAGNYRVNILIGGVVVGSATFTLK